ncbi:DUF4337 domain-containing protein [Kitasatospora sp. CB01950]|uniref:DUF4337 domain-containing protein n=1 Tax=Kitasatospora sp. CB01950 TaxID=1703930 RepID=UPI000AF355B0|nr:DUF4337 domain-containing protein [Kitasatospora sp. CB01950]
MGSTRWRWLVWVGAGISVVGLAFFLWGEGLDRANQWAGVLGLFVGLAGLVLSVTGGIRGRGGGQSADGAAAGGSVRMVRNVKGDVVIGGSPAPGTVPDAATTPVTDTADDGQSARGVRAGGDVNLVDGVEGSVRFGEQQP